MKNNLSQGKSRLSRFSLLTLVSIYVLILIGGIVRSTGSGMGCPDWPKCFGNWVPPTSVDQLPEDYKEVYSSKRAAKNVKLISYLRFLGFSKTADKIESDKSILNEADFNPTKTWIEYVNRLIGVLIGLFIIITVILSIQLISTDRSLFYLASSSLILVIFQGWVGSLVVSTNLIPFMVTFHMLLALLIVGLLSIIVIKTNPQLKVNVSSNKKINLIITLAMVTMLIQIVFGTQVRESIDVIAANFSNRSEWVSQLGMDFILHRSFSWIILLTNGYLIMQLYKMDVFNMTAKAILAVVILSIFTGTIMAYGSVPAFLQPIHLLLGTVGIGLQFFLFLQLQKPVTIKA